MSDTKLNKTQRAVLLAMARHHKAEYSIGTFSEIAEAEGVEASLRAVKAAVRSLAKMGLAELVTLYDPEESGEIRGRGYIATEAGYQLMKQALEDEYNA